MGKNQSASGLTNVIQYSNGNITFVSGSTTLMSISSSGAITTTGVISGSNALSASYAANADTLDGLDSTVFTLTSSFNAQTASFTAFTASLNSFSASVLSYTSSANNRFSSIETVTGSNITRLGALEAATSSLYSYTSSLNLKTASFATTGSNTFIGTQTISGSVLQSGSFTTTGTIIAQTINVQTVTSSIVYSSGSNIFGNLLNNTQTFTGSVLITGSLTIAGASSATSYSGTTIYGSTAVCSPVGLFSGCVGIGTVSPGAKLEVVKADENVLKLKNSGGQPSLVRFNDTSTTLDPYIGSYGNDLAFGTYGGGEKMRITNGGNVGIGCTTPSYPLDVKGTAGTIARITDGTSHITFYAGSGLNEIATVSPLLLTVNGAERLRITSTGIACFACTVCVGGELVVNGASISVNCFNTTATDARINLYTKSATNGDRATIYGYNLAATTAGCEITYLAFGYCCTNNQGYINMQTKSGGAWCNTMSIINGNIGIGTTIPYAKLHVAGTIYSNVRCNTIDTDDGISNNFQGYGGYWALRTDESNGFNLDVYGSGTPKTVLNIPQATGIACFSGTVCAPIFYAGTYLAVNRAGADGVGEGPYLVIAQPSQSKQWIQQLNASAGLDYWHYNGSAWSIPLKLTSAGSTCFACPISVPRVFEKPSDLTVTCNMTGFRSLNLAHQGAAGYIDINPVRLFDLPYQGGLFFIQITTWQRRYEYGIINWVDNGSNVPIVAVNYTTISCNPGVTTPIQISATVPNPGSDNIIRIYICNMHSNGHGYSGMIYAVS
jgi:hypothetical protein